MSTLWLNSMYRALMAHPFDAWRAQNQWLYCEIRDEIAERVSLPPEEVQNHFAREAESAKLAAMKP